jgi:hypothetical protein
MPVASILINSQRVVCHSSVADKEILPKRVHYFPPFCLYFENFSQGFLNRGGNIPVQSEMVK